MPIYLQQEVCRTLEECLDAVIVAYTSHAPLPAGRGCKKLSCCQSQKLVGLFNKQNLKDIECKTGSRGNTEIEVLVNMASSHRSW